MHANRTCKISQFPSSAIERTKAESHFILNSEHVIKNKTTTATRAARVQYIPMSCLSPTPSKKMKDFGHSKLVRMVLHTLMEVAIGKMLFDFNFGKNLILLF